MRINELIVESQQIDELNLAGALGSAAKGAANVIGGARGAWAGAKDVYNQQSGRVANVAQRRVQKAGGYKAPPTPAPQPTTPTTTPAPQTAPAGTVPTAAPQPAPSGTAPTPSPAGTTPATKANTGKLGIPAGRQAVDNAIATIKAVRGDRRPQVVAYGLQQLGAIKETTVGIKSNFLGIEI